VVLDHNTVIFQKEKKAVGGAGVHIKITGMPDLSTNVKTSTTLSMFKTKCFKYLKETSD
jgi:hypothetical protein